MHFKRWSPWKIEDNPIHSSTVSLVKESFGWVKLFLEDAAAIFYAILSEKNPDLKSLDQG
jgi:hypothetical protein